MGPKSLFNPILSTEAPILESVARVALEVLRSSAFRLLQ